MISALPPLLGYSGGCDEPPVSVTYMNPRMDRHRRTFVENAELKMNQQNSKIRDFGLDDRLPGDFRQLIAVNRANIKPVQSPSRSTGSCSSAMDSAPRPRPDQSCHLANICQNPYNDHAAVISMRSNRDVAGPINPGAGMQPASSPNFWKQYAGQESGVNPSSIIHH